MMTSGELLKGLSERRHELYVRDATMVEPICDWCGDECEHRFQVDADSFVSRFCSRECAEAWGSAADEVEPI